MTIADVYFVHQRGMMNSIYVWVAGVGSNLAVVASGFITVDQGWRWVWWWCAIFFAVQIIILFFGFEETKFAPAETLEGRQPDGVSASEHVLASEKTDKQATPHITPEFANVEAGTDDWTATTEGVSTIHINPLIPRKTYLQKLSLLTTSPGPWSHFLRHSWQPFMILGSIPGVLFCSLVYAILLAWSTVMTTALSTYMLDPPYNFSASQIGLMSLAPFIGSTIGSVIVGPASDYTALWLSKRNNCIYEPEMRFWLFLPFPPFQLAGAWWLAYALADEKSWAQVAVAYGVCQFGATPLQSIALTYLLDTYNEIVGDALTAVTFVRNTFSMIFVFAMPASTAAVGIPNVFNTIGAIGIVILCLATFFIWRGKHLRHKTATAYRYYAERQFQARSA